MSRVFGRKIKRKGIYGAFVGPDQYNRQLVIGSKKHLKRYGVTRIRRIGWDVFDYFPAEAVVRVKY